MQSFSAVLSSLFPKKRLILQASSPLQDSISLAISITAIENNLWLRIVVKFFFACKECYFITTSAFFSPFLFQLLPLLKKICHIRTILFANEQAYRLTSEKVLFAADVLKRRQLVIYRKRKGNMTLFSRQIHFRFRFR